MATATRLITPRFSNPVQCKGTNLGWVGSVAAKKHDFGYVDSSGYIAQAASASAAVSIPFGLINKKIASTVAAGATAALSVKLIKIKETDTIELKRVNNSDTEVTVTTAMIGDNLGVYRLSTGDYAADENGSTALEVVGVNLTRNSVICKVLVAFRHL